jgi:hypothetical protein
MVHFSLRSKGPVAKSEQKKEKPKVCSWDLQAYLYHLWLDKMTNCSLYDDAKILHGYSCRCCSRVFAGEQKK